MTEAKMDEAFDQTLEDDASEPIIPPELFPLIADAWAVSDSKRTLVNLMRASHQMLHLCLPSLMRKIEISGSLYWEPASMPMSVAFVSDSLRTDTFALVKSLYIGHLTDWTREQRNSCYGTCCLRAGSRHCVPSNSGPTSLTSYVTRNFTI